MILQNKRQLMTVGLTLLPIFVGLMVYKDLPDQIAIHFTQENQVDSYVSKVFFVYAMPFLGGLVQFFIFQTAQQAPHRLVKGVLT